MKVLFTIFCVLTILFVGGCGLMMLSMEPISSADIMTLVVIAMFVAVVAANIIFIAFAHSSSPQRGRNLRNAALIYAALFAVSVLVVANSNATESILTAILLTVSGFAAVKIIFAFFLGAKIEKDDERAALPTDEKAS
jgi:glucan phosphoethanolaminetransferase (alkaline phosphatase superfamily)